MGKPECSFWLIHQCREQRWSWSLDTSPSRPLSRTASQLSAATVLLCYFTGFWLQYNLFPSPSSSTSSATLSLLVLPFFSVFFIFLFLKLLFSFSFHVSFFDMLHKRLWLCLNILYTYAKILFKLLRSLNSYYMQGSVLGNKSTVLSNTQHPWHLELTY